jgi:hypothetical protein
LIARLVLEETEGTLDDDTPKDAWRDVDGLALSGHDDDWALANDATAKVDSTSGGQVVQLEDLGDGQGGHQPNKRQTCPSGWSVAKMRPFRLVGWFNKVGLVGCLDGLPRIPLLM